MILNVFNCNHRADKWKFVMSIVLLLSIIACCRVYAPTKAYNNITSIFCVPSTGPKALKRALVLLFITCSHKICVWFKMKNSEIKKKTNIYYICLILIHAAFYAFHILQVWLLCQFVSVKLLHEEHIELLSHRTANTYYTFLEEKFLVTLLELNFGIWIIYE